MPRLFAAARRHALRAEDYAGFTLEEADRHRQQWTLANWDDGGELSRYVFLNMPEFWAHSLINRRGAVRELPSTPRPAVANFLTETKLGKRPLRDYVQQTTLDGVIVLHAGNIVFEAYPRMHDYEKHLHMSVSKVYTQRWLRFSKTGS